MATFDGTATDVHSNEIVNNSFYNNSRVHGNFHFTQNTDYTPDPRQNFQNYPVPLPPPLPHPYPPASYPFPSPYAGFESGLAPSCPQWVEQKLSSYDSHPSAPKIHDDLQQGYTPYHLPSAELQTQTSGSLPAPVLPLRFSASRENFSRGFEQRSASPSNNNKNNNNSNNNNSNNYNKSDNNKNSSFQFHHPVPYFQGVTDQYGYGHHYLSMPHPYARPPPQSPYHHHQQQHPTGWTTPLPLRQDQNPAAAAASEGPYLQSNHLSLLRVSPSMYYSQDFAASHPNAAPVRFRASVEYPETSGWSRKEDGERDEMKNVKEEEEEEEREEKRRLKIPANNARKIVYGLHPLPPHMLIQSRFPPPPSSSTSSSSSSSSSSSLSSVVAAVNATQAQPKTTNANMPVPNGTPYNMSAPNGAPYMSVPNGAPYMPVPNGAPYMSVPNGAPYMPVPNGPRYLPASNGTACLPRSLATINEDVPDIRQRGGLEPADGRAATDASDSGAGETGRGTEAESSKEALEDAPKIDFGPAKVLSCLVIVFCGGLLWGVLGFIFAAEGQMRYRKGDREKALKLKGLSYLMSIVGIVCGLMAAIVVGVIYGVYRV